MSREITVLAQVRVTVDLDAYEREYGEKAVARDIRAEVKSDIEWAAKEFLAPRDNIYEVETNIY